MLPEPDGILPISALLCAAFFLISALFSACDAALCGLTLSQVKREADGGSQKSKALLKVAEAQSRLMSPLQLGFVFCGFASFTFALTAFAPPLNRLLEMGAFFKNHPGTRVLTTFFVIALVFSVLFFTLAALLSKKMARRNARRFCEKHLRLLRVLSASAKPILFLCTQLSNGLLHLFRVDPRSLEEAVTEEEILEIVGEGTDRGVIEETEKDMIANILEFNDTTAGEVMTHRTDMVAVSDEDNIMEAVQASVENGCSRIPVYHSDLDTVVGICYIKDLLPYIGKEIPANIEITDLMRPAYFVPESKKCSQLFQEMTERKVQIAIVADEYGGTAGLISLEDLVESIVGNIQDEYDNEEEDIQQMSETEFTVDGSTSIYEISDLTGVELPEGDSDTIAGFVTEILERIPKEDEHPTVHVGRLSMTVLEVSDRRISRLFIVKEPEDSDDKEGDE